MSELMERYNAAREVIYAHEKYPTAEVLRSVHIIVASGNIAGDFAQACITAWKSCERENAYEPRLRKSTTAEARWNE